MEGGIGKVCEVDGSIENYFVGIGYGGYVD